MIGRGHPLRGRHRPLQPGGPPRRAGGAVRARRRAALRPAPRQLGRRLGPAALERPVDLVRRSATRPTRTRSSRSTTSCSGCATRSPTTHLWGGTDIAAARPAGRLLVRGDERVRRAMPAGDGGLEEPQYRAGHRDRARGRDRARRRHRGAAEGLPGPDRRGGRRLGDPRRRRRAPRSTPSATTT